MRELLLAAIVAGLCFTALFKPRIGVYGYVWFSLMRPDILSWSIQRPYSFVLAIAVLIGCVRLLPETPRLIRAPITLGILLLIILAGLSAIFAVDPNLTTTPVMEYLRIILMALLIPLVVRDLTDLKYLLLVMAVSIGVIGLKYGIWGIAAGGVHFVSGIGGLMSDNNAMATGLAMGVALCCYLMRILDSFWVKVGLLVLLVASLTTIVMTQSRGGAIATATVLLLVSLRSKKRVLTLALLALLAAPAIYLVKDSYFDRLATLEDVRHERSAESRLFLAQAAIRMWQDYPLLGVGFGAANEQRLLIRYLEPGDEGSAGLVIHNSYLQMLVDSGCFAFLLYVALLFGTICWLWKSARRVRLAHAGLELYPWAIQTGLVAFAVGGVSLSQVRFDFVYMLLTAAAAWYFIEPALSSESTEESPEPREQSMPDTAYAQ